MKTTALPRELRRLVSEAVALLGQTIEQEIGTQRFERIESIRQSMVGLRGAQGERAVRVLREQLHGLRSLPVPELFEIAHAFSLMLELMNACENAFRTFRLRSEPLASGPIGAEAILWVATAHPTEARSPESIALFHEIQQRLVRVLEEGWVPHSGALKHLLALAWRVRSARARKPTVEDEAAHIYSILLREDSLTTLLRASREVCPVYLRSWVGGDKDGHPGVHEKKMLQSLSLSRAALLRFVRGRLDRIERHLKVLKDPRLTSRHRALKETLVPLSRVKPGDAKRVLAFRRRLADLGNAYKRVVSLPHPSLQELRVLVRGFPALVIPLEMRESASVFMEAGPARKGRKVAIERMLGALKSISATGDPLWYARGLIVSQVAGSRELHMAARMVRRQLGGLKIPVIPLFESEEALKHSVQWVEEFISEPGIARDLKSKWNRHLEFMLGYSDSAKEMGVLPSRVSVAQAIARLDRFCAKRGITPIYFHGAGGSIDRGGGSVKEQMSWWPRSAARRYKATLQGEMVERSFSSPEIIWRQLSQIARNSGMRETTRRSSERLPQAVERFASEVADHYRARVADPAFLKLIELATPYRYLRDLKMGSRPSKRTKEVSLGSLRAIPWILCWTQTRLLFPTWWGIGSAWAECPISLRRQLKRAFRTDPLFRSFIKALGFTLAKVELPVFRLYLENSALSAAEVRSAFRDFSQELSRARHFVSSLADSKDPVWFRPWLGESIHLRSPMIHPLNLIQMLYSSHQDAQLFRECVTGIASGMMTTG